MANSEDMSRYTVANEHYRQRLVEIGVDGTETYHDRWLKDHEAFLDDQEERIISLENLRKEIYDDHRDRTRRHRNQYYQEMPS
ncbi:MAG: hypothetical protein F6K09_19850 [Merismopedia sp. SIO2A8]|nr:hypothetical protein [Symploca sp. SIO2B6]NET50899.1 hypothetical protein [Merismopedia sp. SIO2A8]